ncbi:MAG: hypothetical protein SGI77_24490 [Pirellulaceae bacterium]|nr:hypothetical protein [Pirellulaceae bacterium]
MMRSMLVGGFMLGSSNPCQSIANEQTSGDTQVNLRLYSFIGGKRGDWSVTSSKAIVGEPMASVDKLLIVSGVPQDLHGDAAWVLRGVTSNERYTNRDEKKQLVQKQS